MMKTLKWTSLRINLCMCTFIHPLNKILLSATLCHCCARHWGSSCEESRHSLSNTELIVYGVYELLYLSSVYILIIFKGPVLEMKLLHQDGCSFQIIHTWIIYLKVNIHTVPKKSCTTVQSYSVISKYVKHANVIML